MSWCYAGLTRHLADRPVYGLQATALQGLEQDAADLAKIVDSYMAHIRKVQPVGPYHLLGWSIGGNIAHAMACAFQDQGDEVAMLALMDSGPLPGELRSRAFSSDDIARFIDREGGSLAVVDEQFTQALAVTANRLVQAVSAVPVGHFEGSAVFFTATLSGDGAVPVSEAWSPYISGRIQNYDVEVDHFDMTRPAPIDRISRILEQELGGS